MAIEEAKVLKKPIIASNASGVNGQLSMENSILIKLSPQALAEAVLSLVNDAGKRIALSESLEGYREEADDTQKLYALLE